MLPLFPGGGFLESHYSDRLSPSITRTQFSHSHVNWDQSPHSPDVCPTRGRRNRRNELATGMATARKGLALIEKHITRINRERPLFIVQHEAYQKAKTNPIKHIKLNFTTPKNCRARGGYISVQYEQKEKK